MDRVDACFQLAVEAAELLGEHLGRAGVDYKGDRDPVTDADRASESFLRKELALRFPGDGFLGEEGGASGGGAEWMWVADPLDGTVNFAHGHPYFCVSLALLREGRPVAGAVVDPCGGQAYQAERGAGAYAGGRRLAVSQVGSLDRALASTDFPYDLPSRTGRGVRRVQAMLSVCQGLRIRGACALELCHLAAGHLDLFAGDGTHPWDVAAGTLILEEAGGKVTDWWGRPLELLGDTRWPLATNGIIHGAAVAQAEAYLPEEAALSR